MAAHSMALSEHHLNGHIYNITTYFASLITQLVLHGSSFHFVYPILLAYISEYQE